MNGLVLYDDARARTFHPFALTRPLGEMRAGAALIRERWCAALNLRATGFVGAPHLIDFAEFDAPPALRDELPTGTWLINSRCAPALARVALPAQVDTLRCGDRVAATRLRAPMSVATLDAGDISLDALASADAVEIGGWWLEAPWDIVGHLPAMLLADAAALMPSAPDARAMTVLGSHPVHAANDAVIEPWVIADATAGPVLVQSGAHIQAFTRLVGPCVIGEGSSVLGGRVAACSIGPKVKVCGEISVTVMLGHANKGHDGFVGHSIIGRWANLGAGTITSNLKNSYGTVTMWTPDGQRSTGLQFLGSLIGDHAKTGIGTRLPTGAVVAAAANVFGTRMPPKYVPPFAWGDGEPWETFDLDRFLTVAERVMGRRGERLPPNARLHWERIFALRAP